MLVFILALWYTCQELVEKPSTATVRVVYEGKTISLPYVRAARFEPNDGPPRLHLLFTAAAPVGIVLANSFGEDPSSVTDWAGQRDEVAVVISMTEGQEQNYITTMAWGSSAYAASGSSAFSKVQITKDRITGDMLLDQPGVLRGSFDVAIETSQETPFTTGPHVAKSAQAGVLIAYARALSTRDLKAAQALSASNVEQEYHAARQDLGEKFVAQMIAARYGDVPMLDQDFSSVDASLREAGDRAQIRLKRVVQNPRGDETRTQTFNFVRVNGAWKIK